jgi:hypothetical protein
LPLPRNSVRIAGQPPAAPPIGILLGAANELLNKISAAHLARDRQQHVHSLRDCRIRVGVDQGTEQAVPRPRIPNEQTEQLSLLKPDRPPRFTVSPARQRLSELRERCLAPLIPQLTPGRQRAQGVNRPLRLLQLGAQTLLILDATRNLAARDPTISRARSSSRGSPICGVTGRRLRSPTLLGRSRAGRFNWSACKRRCLKLAMNSDLVAYSRLSVRRA